MVLLQYNCEMRLKGAEDSHAFYCKTRPANHPRQFLTSRYRHNVAPVKVKPPSARCHRLDNLCYHFFRRAKIIRCSGPAHSNVSGNNANYCIRPRGQIGISYHIFGRKLILWAIILFVSLWTYLLAYVGESREGKGYAISHWTAYNGAEGELNFRLSYWVAMVMQMSLGLQLLLCS